MPLRAEFQRCPAIGNRNSTPSSMTIGPASEVRGSAYYSGKRAIAGRRRSSDPLRRSNWRPRRSAGPVGEDPTRIANPVYQELQLHGPVTGSSLCLLLTGLSSNHHFSAAVTLSMDPARPGRVALDFDVADRCRSAVESLAATYLVAAHFGCADRPPIPIGLSGTSDRRLSGDSSWRQGRRPRWQSLKPAGGRLGSRSSLRSNPDRSPIACAMAGDGRAPSALTR